MKLYFREEDHRYFNENNQEYISVSALAKKLEAPKDWNKIKVKYAKKHGISIDEVNKEWDRKRILGTQAGTIYHQKREQELLNSPQIIKNVICSKSPCSFTDGLKHSIPIDHLENNTIYPELIIYDHDKLVCGQSDKVVIVNKTIDVFDYKTDKSIDRKAYTSEWVSPEKLLFPVSHLDNCNFNMYSLKMSMYMYMLWNANKDCRVGKLILEYAQLERDDDGIPILINGSPIVLSTENIEVPFRKKEVRDIFNHYKLKKL